MEVNRKDVKAFCVAGGGPRDKTTGSVTNLNWSYTVDDLQKVLGPIPIYFLNDIEAQGLGLNFVDASHLIQIYPDAPPSTQIEDRHHSALIVPGTGLGEAVLHFNGSSFDVIACEGGHTDFAINDEIDYTLWKLVKGEIGRVSIERIISGAFGFGNIYRSLRLSQDGIANLDEYLKNIFGGDLYGNGFAAKDTKDFAQLVYKEAFENNSPLAIEVFSLFLKYLGQEIGNMALKTMSRSGIYVAGSIVRRLLKVFPHDYFTNAYTSKGRFQSFLQQTPIYFVNDEHLALKGCAHNIVIASVDPSLRA